MEWSWLIFQIKSKGMSLRKWWKTQIVSSSPLTFLPPSPNLLQTLLLVPEAPWFLDKHVWWLSDWHSLNETRHTQIYLELSFAFKPFPFCGVASNFSFFLKRSSSRTQESSGMGARVWSPVAVFSGLKEKHRLLFDVSFRESKTDERMEKKEPELGRMERRKGKRKGRREIICLFSFPPDLKTSCLMSLCVLESHRGRGMGSLGNNSSTAQSLSAFPSQVTRMTTLLLPTISRQSDSTPLIHEMDLYSLCSGTFLVFSYTSISMN